MREKPATIVKRQFEAGRIRRMWFIRPLPTA
jgi:hypothetical protein